MISNTGEESSTEEGSHTGSGGVTLPRREVHPCARRGIPASSPTLTGEIQPRHGPTRASES